jgi:hypothetical protein
MKTYIVFVDRSFGVKNSIRQKLKTKRFEINALDISSACEKAIEKNGGGEISMFWPK